MGLWSYFKPIREPEHEAVTSAERMSVPTGLEAPLAQLLWDLVEEGMPEGEFWRRWASLREQSAELERLEGLLRLYLEARKDPYASSRGMSDLHVDRTFQWTRRLLRRHIAGLQEAVNPNLVRYPLAAAATEPSPTSLPVVTAVPVGLGSSQSVQRVQRRSRDASFAVKLWIAVSAVLMLGSVAVKSDWRDSVRLVGQFSLLASVLTGLRQCSGTTPEKPAEVASDHAEDH